MTDPFARMHSRLHAHFGKSSTIRGSVSTEPIVIERGVAVSGDYGEVVAYRDVAVISVADAPRPGDAIVVDGQSYVIDAPMENNGYSGRWIVR